MQGFARTAVPDADVTEVANAIVKVVDMPFGKRPFRIHVDPANDGAEVVEVSLTGCGPNFSATWVWVICCIQPRIQRKKQDPRLPNDRDLRASRLFRTHPVDIAILKDGLGETSLGYIEHGTTYAFGRCHVVRKNRLQ